MVEGLKTGAQLDVGGTQQVGPPIIKGDLALIPVRSSFRAWPVSRKYSLAGTIVAYGNSGTSNGPYSGEIVSISATTTIPVESGLSGGPVFLGDQCIGIVSAIVNSTLANGRVSSGGLILLF